MLLKERHPRSFPCRSQWLPIDQPARFPAEIAVSFLWEVGHPFPVCPCPVFMFAARFMIDKGVSGTNAEEINLLFCFLREKFWRLMTLSGKNFQAFNCLLCANQIPPLSSTSSKHTPKTLTVIFFCMPRFTARSSSNMVRISSSVYSYPTF